MKNVMLTVRITEDQMKRFKTMADIYANGDLSSWVRHCLEEYRPKIIKKGPASRQRHRAKVHTN